MLMFNDIVWDAHENKEQFVFNIQRQLNSMLVDSVAANSLAVIGLSWDQKKNGTEPILTNHMDHGSTGRRYDGNFLSIGSSDISCLQCL